MLKLIDFVIHIKGSGDEKNETSNELIQPFQLSFKASLLLFRVRPSGESLPLAVKLRCCVLACAAVDSYLSARVGAGEDTPGCIREGSEIRYWVLISPVPLPLSLTVSPLCRRCLALENRLVEAAFKEPEEERCSLLWFLQACLLSSCLFLALTSPSSLLLSSLKRVLLPMAALLQKNTAIIPKDKTGQGCALFLWIKS